MNRSTSSASSISSSQSNGSCTTLLKPKTLNNVLAQANTGGIKCTIILNHEGSLLAHAGGTNNDAITIAALASTIWKNYQRYGNAALQEDKLKSATIQTQEANLIVMNVSSVLLCICANHEVPLGMLKCKARKMAEFLEEPLNLILNN